MLDDFSGTGRVHVGFEAQFITGWLAIDLSSNLGSYPAAAGAYMAWTGEVEGRVFDCGDVNGDGVLDLCASSHLVLGPLTYPDAPESRRVAPTITWDADGSTLGLAADLDGDGVNEVYITTPNGPLAS